jgi:hypothetical protein
MVHCVWLQSSSLIVDVETFHTQQDIVPLLHLLPWDQLFATLRKLLLSVKLIPGTLQHSPPPLPPPNCIPCISLSLTHSLTLAF